MELAKQAGCKKVVFASSSSLYNGLTPQYREDMEIKVTDYYTKARLAIERIAELYYKLYGIDYAALRCSRLNTCLYMGYNGLRIAV